MLFAFTSSTIRNSFHSKLLYTEILINLILIFKKITKKLIKINLFVVQFLKILTINVYGPVYSKVLSKMKRIFSMFTAFLNEVSIQFLITFYYLFMIIIIHLNDLLF